MVCFVILHYMALDETILCVESIRDSVEGEKKIIIVDNCSPNGTIKGLEEHYQDAADVDVLETGENLGFAKGNNFGYAYAVRHLLHEEEVSPESADAQDADKKGFGEELQESYDQE